MSIDIYQMDIGDLTVNANITKDLVVAAMVKDGIIPAEVGRAWADSRRVIAYKPSWFKRFFKGGSDTPCMRVVNFGDGEASL